MRVCVGSSLPTLSGANVSISKCANMGAGWQDVERMPIVASNNSSLLYVCTFYAPSGSKVTQPRAHAHIP
jgi:hypothetical protein